MNTSEIKLVINKQIQAPVEDVYRAWTNPEMIKQWFGPDSTMTVPEAGVELEVGGEYMIHMHHSEGDSDHIVSGVYEKIIPNEKLVFSWKWKDGVDTTQVTIDLKPKGKNETLLTLTHRGFSQQEFADKHNQGWSGCLASLATFLIPNEETQS